MTWDPSPCGATPTWFPPISYLSKSVPFSLSSRREPRLDGKQAAREQTKVTATHVITRVLSPFFTRTEALLVNSISTDEKLSLKT